MFSPVLALAGILTPYESKKLPSTAAQMLFFLTVLAAARLGWWRVLEKNGWEGQEKAGDVSVLRGGRRWESWG